ncbi:FKBP-type peptidyl-prolyl cis-trans isomerase [Leifsonia sp. NPDC058292]|uniref:FKBP-type peptidyl-prolyl cis-trans isomerase n=1 Tax=Leifsonia sp. NPDC058292 TaxID=3346428 RepID=UPI0036DA6394
MRKTLSVLAAGLVVAALAACSSGSPTSSSTPTASTASLACVNVKSGSVSDSVKIASGFGADPQATFKSPLKTSELQRTVTIKGGGAEVKGGDSIDIALAAYNGTDGKPVAASAGFDGQAAQTISVDANKFVPGIVRAVECLPLKSRIVMTGPASQMFGNVDLTQFKLKATDPVVFVIDTVSKVPTRANGKDVAPAAGFPTVKLAKSGAPTVTIPKTDPPTETKIALLKQGDGDTVVTGDTITIQYSGLLWRNGQVFDSTWTKGAAYTGIVDQFVPGFTKALIGQKVGSQVIAIIPPADGYGAKGNGDIKPTDTMVFVVDILKTVR